MTAEPCGDAEKLCDFERIVQEPVAKAATRARADVDALWRLVTGGPPLGLATWGPEARASLDAGSLLLVGVAAGAPRAERTELVAKCLDILGWRAGPFAP